MLEITEKILASINAKPMKKGEIYELPYLKTISDYGIEWSLSELVRKGFVKETCYAKNPKHSFLEFKYKVNKSGVQYLSEHGYLD